jgi:hypothetical protein
VADDTAQQQSIAIIGVANLNGVDAARIDTGDVEISLRSRFEDEGEIDYCVRTTITTYYTGYVA